jgi:hypothetical protein
MFTIRLFFFSILTFTSVLSILTCITFILPPETETFQGVTEQARYQVLSDIVNSNTVTETIDRFPDSLSISILVFCLVIIVITLFIWTPSFSNVLSTERNGRMVWVRTKLGIPERLFCFKDGNFRIKIRRNRSSLSGLLMRVFNLEIHFSHDSPEIQRISNFTGMKRYENSKKQPILSKTVKLKNLPVQIIQVQAVLKTIA